MLGIIICVIVLFVQLIAPTYVSIIIAIANMFVPDTVPLIDEVLGVAIAVKKLKD